MKKNIPQRTEVTCDFCGRKDDQVPFKKTATVSIQQSALDVYGEAAACGSVQWDACDTCAQTVQHLLEAFKQKGGANVR